MWRFLRKKQLNGRKFLRQYAIIYESNRAEHFFYVPDFFCQEEKLAIELDGKIHIYTKKRDERRDVILEDMGIKVLRFKNEELINDKERVLQEIRNSFLSDK